LRGASLAHARSGHVDAAHLDPALPASDPTPRFGRATTVVGELDRVRCAHIGDKGGVGELACKGGCHGVRSAYQLAVADNQHHVIGHVRPRANGVARADQAVG
jgi:hypothetical protein